MRTRTPMVITGIRGTEYRLKVEDAQTTTVETLSGEVAVQSGVNSVQLRADQGLRASSGRKLGKPQILPLPPVVTGIEEVYRTLPVHFHLPSQPNIRATKLRLSSDEAGQATVYEHDAPTGTPLQMSNVPDGQYFAFFTATDNKGFESREQGPHALLIRTKPPAPMVSAPRNGSILWGKFAQVSWLESEQAVQYLVQVGRDAQFNDLVDEQKLATPVYSSPELAPGTYYFRVQSLAADGFASNFSGTVQWEQKRRPPWVAWRAPAMSCQCCSGWPWAMVGSTMYRWHATKSLPNCWWTSRVWPPPLTPSRTSLIRVSTISICVA